MTNTQDKKQYRVLIVEDDTFLSEIYTVKFKQEGFKVFTALDGEAGLKMATKELPDIILLDLLLPKLDGFQVLDELKEQQSTKLIPVILLTNLGQKEDVDKCLKLGAADYLIKANFTPQETVKRVQKILNIDQQ